MPTEIIANYHCTLAEGPLWDSEKRLLYWTDIDNGRLYKYNPRSGESSVCLETDKIGGFTLQKDGSLLLFMARGAIKIWDGQNLKTVHAEIAGETETRFNDVIADPIGRVLCGLMPTQERNGNLYRLDTDGSLTLLLDDVACSNGMGFINGDRQIYFTDTGRNQISLFDYDPVLGEITGRRHFWSSQREGAKPDGMTLDAEGCVWTALWGGGCVVRLDPSGNEIGLIEIPGAKNITSVIFGGGDLADLYITSAAVGDDSSPNAGAIFRARPGVQGLPEYRSNVLIK